MKYNEKTQKTEEGLIELIDMLSIPSPDRFVASLLQRNYNELDVSIQLVDLRRGLALVNGEALRLAKLELTGFILPSDFSTG